MFIQFVYSVFLILDYLIFNKHFFYYLLYTK